MLEERGVEYAYREYRTDPLNRAELRDVFAKLGLRPRDLLRVRDNAMKAAGIQGNESDAALIAAMAEHPTLLQRPIGVRGDRAVVGRPPEALLTLLDEPSTSG